MYQSLIVQSSKTVCNLILPCRVVYMEMWLLYFIENWENLSVQVHVGCGVLMKSNYMNAIKFKMLINKLWGGIRMD